MDTPGADGLVGRGSELREIAAFLDSGRPPDALVVTGNAGIGKTALWERAAEHAQGRGWHVLAARAVEAETSLPWVGITDLLAQHVRMVAALPDPQRGALEVAALRAAPTGPQPDERTVGTAIGSVLQLLTGDAPVLIAIDDIGHLDVASGKALRFALRRLPEDAPVRILATARTADDLPLDAMPGGTSTLRLGPVTVAALYQLLSERLNVTFSRPTLVRIHETCDGNPLYAIELATALQHSDVAPAPGRPLPVPDTLPALIERRLAALAEPVRRVLAAASATWHLDAASLDDDAVLAALDAGVLVRTQSGRVRPAHPLLGVAAYALLEPAEQIRLHAELAAASSDPAEQARHLALANPDVDPQVAAVLDEAADAVAQHGASDAAADLARLAVERTAPAEAAYLTRLQRLADFLFKAGDPREAIAAQRRAIAACPPGTARARQLIRLAEFVPEAEGWNAAIPILEEALEQADDIAVAAEVHMTLSRVIYDDAELERYHAQRLVDLVASMPDPPPLLAVEALTRPAHAFYDGYPLDHESFRRAIEIEREHPSRRLSDASEAAYAALLKYADDLDEAAGRFTDLVAQCEISGDLSSEAYVRSHLPTLELWRGDVAAARRQADEFLVVAETAALAWSTSLARYTSGIVASYEGRVDEARALLTEALPAAGDDLFNQARIHGAIGFLEWSVHDAQAAVEHLDTWHEMAEQVRLGHPGLSRHHLDYVEVLVSLGRVADAAGFVDWLTERAERADSRYGRAAAAVGRGVVVAAQGDVDAAGQHADAALAAYAAVPLRFDRARALLVKGYLHRRAKAKLAARAALEAARDEFTAIGAPLWAARAAEELRRVNIRPAAPDELTETEARVAELAATGRTNKQVADELFLATKTVEANLAKVYRKLGIKSRAELGALFTDRTRG